MKWATFMIAVIFLCTAAAAPEVIFVSPCECQSPGRVYAVQRTESAAASYLPATCSDVRQSVRQLSGAIHPHARDGV